MIWTDGFRVSTPNKAERAHRVRLLESHRFLLEEAERDAYAFLGRWAVERVVGGYWIDVGTELPGETFVLLAHSNDRPKEPSVPKPEPAKTEAEEESPADRLLRAIREIGMTPYVVPQAPVPYQPYYQPVQTTDDATGTAQYPGVFPVSTSPYLTTGGGGYPQQGFMGGGGGQIYAEYLHRQRVMEQQMAMQGQRAGYAEYERVHQQTETAKDDASK